MSSVRYFSYRVNWVPHIPRLYSYSYFESIFCSDVLLVNFGPFMNASVGRATTTSYEGINHDAFTYMPARLILHFYIKKV